MFDRREDAYYERNGAGAVSRDRQSTLTQHLGDISLEYPYEDLVRATDKFSFGNQIGKGAAGTVYKGVLRGGSEVAVKVISNASSSKEFSNEVLLLSRLRHPNVVTLFGWGRNRDEKFLVYELLDGSDAGKRLDLCKRGSSPFPWDERVRLACDVACGLSHMVNSEPKVFHRDIKPANLLFDANGGGKVADFGLSSTTNAVGKAHLTVQDICGTPGYACPDYIRSLRVTEASEVFSFGVVLLELLINLPPALVGRGELVYPLFERVLPASAGADMRVLEALDHEAGWPRPLVDEFAELALSCSSMNVNRRPTFANVVKILRQLKAGAGSEQRSGRQNQRPLLQPEREGCREQRSPAWQPPVANPPAYFSAATSRQRQSDHIEKQQYASQPKHQQQYPPQQHQQQQLPVQFRDMQPRRSSSDGSELGEIVLEAVYSEGIDLSRLHVGLRAISFPVLSGRLCATVGRQQQPEFFERVVPNKDPTLRKLTANDLLVDDRPMTGLEAVTLKQGTRIGFVTFQDSAKDFMALHAVLRSKKTVDSEGRHPSATMFSTRNSSDTNGGVKPKSPGPKVHAVLECISYVDPKIGVQSRVIPLVVDEEKDIGRQHQLGFFELLLQSDPTHLSFISRSHCKVLLSRQVLSDEGVVDEAPSPVKLQVETLSQNPLMVDGKLLAKGKQCVIGEGGTLCFVTKKDGEDHDTTILEFMLRKARS